MSWFEPTILLLILYAFQIRKFEKGWDMLPRFTAQHKAGVSVVVAARNEAENIEELLKDLSQQTHDNLEVIVVDDHSADDTAKIVASFPNVILLNASQEGKKAAIAEAVEAAKHSIILTTDADCRLSTAWVEKMIAPFINEHVSLVVGPVAFHEEVSDFEKAQSLEFMSLITSGAGAIGAQQAFMCNGANLAFRKANYAAVNTDKASGDDVFLLHHAKKNGSEIVFVKEYEAIVTTAPKPDFNSLLQQRKRWAAKSSDYHDKDAKRISWLVFLSNLCLLLLIFSGTWREVLIAFVLKAIIDYSLLKKAVAFFQKEDIFRYFYPLQILYPFYIVYVAVASQMGGFEWKGRKHKK